MAHPTVAHTTCGKETTIGMKLRWEHQDMFFNRITWLKAVSCNSRTSQTKTMFSIHSLCGSWMLSKNWESCSYITWANSLKTEHKGSYNQVDEEMLFTIFWFSLLILVISCRPYIYGVMLTLFFLRETPFGKLQSKVTFHCYTKYPVYIF